MFDKNEINKFNFFVKEIRDFENIFGENFNSRLVDIILQIENSIIAENPYSVLEFDRNDLIVSTPQKLLIIIFQPSIKFGLMFPVPSGSNLIPDHCIMHGSFKKIGIKNLYD